MDFTKAQVLRADKLVNELEFGRVRLAEDLDISKYAASQLIERIKTGFYADVLGTPNSGTKAQSKVKKLLDKNLSLYDIALEHEVGLSSAETLVKKAKAKYAPVEDDLREIAVNGVKFSVLKEKFGFSSVESAKTAISEAFEDSFVITLGNESNPSLLPVNRSERDWEKMSGKVVGKDFEYFTSDANDYMLIKFSDDVPGECLNLYMFTDVHFGAKAHMHSQSKECINKVLNDPAGFWIDCGDTTENASRNTATDPMDQYLTNNEQIEKAVTSYGPIKHKGVAKLEGNHEERTQRYAQVNISKIIAQFLGLPHFEKRVTIDIVWRNHLWTVMASHEWLKAIAPEKVIQAVEKVYNEITHPVNFFLSGHNHTAFVHEGNVERKFLGKGYHTMRYYVVNGGSFMRRTNTYASTFKPRPQDFMYLKFYSDGNYEPDRLRFNSK